jgi:hypothetical protein
MIPSVPVVAENSVPPSTLLQADATPTKIEKANLRSASRGAIAIWPTSNSWHRSRVSSAEEALLTPTISGSLSSAQWDAR